MPADLQTTGQAEFVALTTFRRSGEGVTTPVWIAPVDDPAGPLVVTTMRSTGKVKRIRNNAEVTLVPCSRTGKVEPGAVPVTAHAVVADDPDGSYHRALQRKYKLPYRLFMLAEKLPFSRRASGRCYLVISAS